MKIVCICGSTRFWETHQLANERETVKGNIVLASGVNLKDPTAHERASAQVNNMDQLKTKLDELHRRKIEMADEVLVIDVDGYIGESTRAEIAYAQSLGKPVRYWSEENS